MTERLLLGVFVILVAFVTTERLLYFWTIWGWNTQFKGATLLSCQFIAGLAMVVLGLIFVGTGSVGVYVDRTVGRVVDIVGSEKDWKLKAFQRAFSEIRLRSPQGDFAEELNGRPEYRIEKAEDLEIFEEVYAKAAGGAFRSALPVPADFGPEEVPPTVNLLQHRPKVALPCVLSPNSIFAQKAVEAQAVLLGEPLLAALEAKFYLLRLEALAIALGTVGICAIVTAVGAWIDLEI